MTTIKPEVLDELLSGVSSPEDLMGDAGLFKQLKARPGGPFTAPFYNTTMRCGLSIRGRYTPAAAVLSS
jgi:hypothetical protein